MVGETGTERAAAENRITFVRKLKTVPYSYYSPGACCSRCRVSSAFRSTLFFISDTLSLFAGLSCLRLVKVEIPPYKFRGESALLECVYELNGGQVVGGHLKRTRGQEHSAGGQYYAARYRQQSAMDYINHPQADTALDEDENDSVVEEFKYAKRKRKKYERFRKYAAEDDEETDDEHDNDDLVLEADRAADPYHQPKHRHGAVEEDEDEDVDTHEEDLIEDMVHSSKGGSGFPEALYSVKWYKDNEEFYRYVPKANPPQNSYKVEGIRVDVSRS